MFPLLPPKYEPQDLSALHSSSPTPFSSLKCYLKHSYTQTHQPHQSHYHYTKFNFDSPFTPSKKIFSFQDNPLPHLFLLLWTGIKIPTCLISVVLSKLQVGYKIFDMLFNQLLVIFYSVFVFFVLLSFYTAMRTLLKVKEPDGTVGCDLVDRP